MNTDNKELFQFVNAAEKMPTNENEIYVLRRKSAAGGYNMDTVGLLNGCFILSSDQELPIIPKDILHHYEWLATVPSPASTDRKYPIGGYAPGTYMNICTSCNNQFMGDKRAVQCEPCAIKMTTQPPTDTALQDRAVAWWNELSIERKDDLCSKYKEFKNHTYDEVYSHDIIKVFLAETTDTMCSCGLLQSQHQPYCKNEKPAEYISVGDKRCNLFPQIQPEDILPEGVYCICDNCKGGITYDLIVPDELWAVISPRKMDGWKTGGLLCPECIMDKTIKFYTDTILRLQTPDVAAPIKKLTI